LSACLFANTFQNQHVHISPKFLYMLQVVFLWRHCNMLCTSSLWMTLFS